MKSCNSGPTVSLSAKLTTALPPPHRIAASIFTPTFLPLPMAEEEEGRSGLGAINGLLCAKYATFTF